MKYLFLLEYVNELLCFVGYKGKTKFLITQDFFKILSHQFLLGSMYSD